MQGFHYCFQQKGNWFSEAGKTISTELLCRKNCLLGGQTSRAKSSSQLVNLPSAALNETPVDA